VNLLPAFVGMPAVNRVYNVDALTLLRALPAGSVDAIITDPPYGLAGRVFEFPHKRYSAVNEAWDHYAPTDWMAHSEKPLREGGSVICFGGRRSIYELAAEGLSLGWRLVNDITWNKPDAPPNFTGRMLTETTERALWFCPSGSGWTYHLDAAKSMNSGMNLRDIWKFYTERDGRQHPTQKPLDLMERCILLFTKPGDLVVDPFSGSGTTGVAAIKHGRRFIGCDNGVDTVTGRFWSEIANERLSLPYTLPMFTESAS
jgi:site-specific DNA-methyltransferase (adenine-specific)